MFVTYDDPINNKPFESDEAVKELELGKTYVVEKYDMQDGIAVAYIEGITGPLAAERFIIAYIARL